MEIPQIPCLASFANLILRFISISIFLLSKLGEGPFIYYDQSALRTAQAS